MLFASSKTLGTFKGFNDKGLEFAAEIVAPYDGNMLEQPQLGQFVLVELGSPDEASLGRITKFVPAGLLSSAEGEDYMNTMQRRNQAVPEDLKQQRLKYRVQIKLLGAVKALNGGVVYVPSQRRLPHLGATVAFPSAQVLQELCKLSGGATSLGDFVLGEFVFCGTKQVPENDIFRCIDPPLTVSFDMHNLVSRRSVVFARAGYGKSNLIKFLVAELYKSTPKTDSGLPVGTLIFDADGEYFWPDTAKHPPRPGLCDVPHLQDKLVVYTNRTHTNQFYGSFKAGNVQLDIRDLPARDVISIAISPERQSQQNVLKLKQLSRQNWAALVDLIFAQGLQADETQVANLMGYTQAQAQQAAAEIAAAKSNMNAVVRSLHDPKSKLLSGTIKGLQTGAVVVLDISLLSSAAGEMIAGLLLRKLFSFNQENFTGGHPIIPVVTIIEEAQSVLGKHLEETSPFVEWVKEGRKYELGAILVTQQPGSMAPELLSQADNWFAFHLLAEIDAGVLGRYNSHYSDDVQSHLIGEPIRGNCYVWSAPHQPFVLPVRVRSFEKLYSQYVNTKAEKVNAGGFPAGEIQQVIPLPAAVAAVAESAEDAESRLAKALLERLLEHSTKYWLAQEINQTYWLIKDSQLFVLIKMSKQPSDTQHEGALKSVLLDRLFGAGTIQPYDHNGIKYWRASAEVWSKLLGTPSNLTPLS